MPGPVAERKRSSSKKPKAPRTEGAPDEGGVPASVIDSSAPAAEVAPPTETLTDPAAGSAGSAPVPAGVPGEAEPPSRVVARKVVQRATAPGTESIEQLARKVAKVEPHRGSMMQPPPAWTPDEVTLGFAIVADEATGTIHELPEPTLLATILTAVDTERHRLIHRLAGRSDEEIEAVANLFWPLIVMAGRKSPEVAIFDGTGVWKRSFRYTLLPNLEQIPKLVEAKLPPSEYLDHVRTLLPHFAHDPGAEVLTVEGFLPVDPPLLFDVLSHSEFRSDPQSPHAGFLPARHDVKWYYDTVSEMYRWLDRFDTDLKTLSEARERIRGVLKEMDRRLEEEYRRLQAEGRERVQEATAQSETETAEVHKGHRVRIQQHAAAIRHAQAVLAYSETTISTADTLSFRATHRRSEGEPHAARRRDAEGQVRAANREIAERRQAIERVHADERADLERVLERVALVEQRYARTLAERELFRDEFTASGNDLLQAIDGQIAARSAQKNLLAGYFLPVESLSGVRVVWFPLWVATLRSSRGIRQLVFPPMQVRTGRRLTGALKQLFGGVVLPLEPRTAQFDKVLRTTMEEALLQDPWLATATQELTRAADVLVDPDVLHRLQIGLRDLGGNGWITEKQEHNLLATYVARAQQRAATPTGPSSAPPPVTNLDSPGPSEGSPPSPPKSG